MIRALSRLFFLLLLATRLSSAQPLPDRVPLAGLALDSAGKPLANAIISLRRQEANGAYTFWGAVTASDARGAWRFPQAEAGRYYLSAEVSGFAPLSNQNVQLKAGDAPLRLRFERLIALSLKVVGPDAAPLSNTRLWLRLRGDGNAGQITRHAVTDEDGNATLDELLPATYALFLSTPRGFALQNGLLLLSNKTLNLNLQRGGTLFISASQTGQTDANGRKVGGATLNLTPENPAEATRALGSSADLNENVAFLAAGGNSLALVSRDGDGQIEISGLPPGRYLARLRLPSHDAPAPQVVSIESGQIASLQFGLTPSAVPNPAPNSSAMTSLSLDLRLRDTAGVEKRAPVGEWAVRVLPLDANGALAPEEREDSTFMPGGNVARRALTDQNGQLTLFPLRVGRYRVFVAPRTAPAEGSEPEAASIDTTVPASGVVASLVVPATP